MKNYKFSNTDCSNFDVQELSIGDQISVNGGSGLGRLAGWIVGGAAAAGCDAVDFLVSVYRDGTYSVCD